MLLIVPNNSDGVIGHDAADRTAGVDGQGDGPVRLQDEAGGMEVERLLVDVSADHRSHRRGV